MHRRHFLRSAVAGLGVAGLGLSRISKVSAQAFRAAPNPYPAKQQIYHCDLLIVGGSSAGTAAALTAGRLGID
ncbi:MAG TPA: FAD-dependent oxidoreductase, partial [bacterium]|nr:FAD-dependent oxidoreductase [bacterium]